jgi:cytochrome c-type biogenesis protein CcmF
VHSFATDPTRGIYILIIIFVFYLLAAILYGTNQHKIHTSQATLHLQSKAGLILINNLFNLLILAIILLGTIYPMILDLFTSRKITVGAPYFNKIISPIALFLLFAVAFIDRLAWDKPRQLTFKSFSKELAFALVITGLIFACNSFAIELSVLGIFVALFFIAMNAVKKNTWAVYLAHMGFAILILGLSLNTYFSHDIETIIHPDNPIELRNFAITFHGIEYVEQSNYVARRAEFSVVPSYAEGPFYLYPETRLYLIEQQQTAESAIYHNFFYDFYLTIGNISDDGGIVIRAYLRPAMLLIWISCLLIAGAGVGLIRFLTNGFQKNLIIE